MKELAATIEILKESKDFFSFDIFLINKMGMHSSEIKRSEEITEEIRQNAYHEFMRRIGVNRVAAMQTIQKWFGIHGNSMPDRETMIKLAFSLQLSLEEAEEYLKCGIGEPGFLVNDYRETLFMYSLQKGYTYEEALRLIDQFEERFLEDTVLVVHNETNKLWRIFMDKKELEPEQFLAWMMENAGYFKGYNMTILNYLQAYKQEILEEVKKEAAKRLEELLAETAFYRWKDSHGYSDKNIRKTILLFLDRIESESGERVSKALESSIRELLKITAISVESNMELLLELYASAVENKNFDRNKRKAIGEIGWNFLDHKYLSEILNIGHQKEKRLRLLLLKKKLERQAGFKKCSRKTVEQAVLLGYQGKKWITVNELKEWIEVSVVQVGRRIRLVQRQDLLPLILSVAQIRYSYKLEQGEKYDMENARAEFKELADTTFAGCDMEPLQTEKYKLDALMWNCFQEREMYSISDVLEIF